MCRPLYYLLLQPCASDAQTAAAKWVIQPWGSPALPLSLYPPLPQSPLVPLSLLPSSIQSLPLHPSSPLPTAPPDISSHMLFFIYWPNPTVWVSLHLSICLPQNVTTFPLFSSSVLFSRFIILSVSMIFYHLLFHFYQINKNWCFIWKSPDGSKNVTNMKTRR